MVRFLLSFILSFVNLIVVAAFVTKHTIRHPYIITRRVHLMQGDPFLSLTTSSSTVIATIDSDIAKISNEDFGLVFAGGILVMVGGVLSALIVGFILEKSNSYAQIVADSYAEGGDDAFLNSLSPDDRDKAKDMLEKLRQSKERGTSVSGEAKVNAVNDKSNDTIVSGKPKERETANMFNDYSE